MIRTCWEQYEELIKEELEMHLGTPKEGISLIQTWDQREMDECYSQYICIERNEPENDFEKEMTTHESQSDHVYEGKWGNIGISSLGNGDCDTGGFKMRKKIGQW